MNFNINLLPWRLQKKRYKKRYFQCCIIAVFLLSSFLVWVVNSYLNHLTQRQTVHYHQLISQGHQLDLLIKQAKESNERSLKHNLKKKIIHKIYSHRDSMARMLNFLQQMIPSEVVLSRIERQKNEITLYGVLGCQTLRDALSKNASVLFIKPSEVDKKDCKIQFKLRPNTI
jgi:type IV pilus assembly protein PilN